MTALALLAVAAVAAGLSRLGHRALTQWEERSRYGDQEHVVTGPDAAKGGGERQGEGRFAPSLGAAGSAVSAGPPPGLPGAGGPT